MKEYLLMETATELQYTSTYSGKQSLADTPTVSSPCHEELHVNGWRFGSSAVRRSLTGWQGSSPLLTYSSLSATANTV